MSRTVDEILGTVTLDDLAAAAVLEVNLTRSRFPTEEEAQAAAIAEVATTMAADEAERDMLIEALTIHIEGQF